MRATRGLALLTTLVLLPVVVILAFCLASIGIQNLASSLQGQNGKVAAYVAEAGASAGCAWLKNEPNYEGVLTYPMVRLPDSATVRVLNNLNGTTTRYATNGARVPPGFAYVLSSCTTPAPPRMGRVTRHTGVLLKVTGALPFKWATFGSDSVKMTGGSITDSWDSSAGSYLATVSTWGGSVGTNSVASGGVTLSGTGTTINGDVTFGPGGSAPAVVTGGGLITGTVSAATSEFSMPAVQIPAALTSTFLGTPTGGGPFNLSPGYWGDVSVTGGKSLILSAGVYVFDSLGFSGGSTLTVPKNDNVTIYITGKTGKSLDLSGGSVLYDSGGTGANGQARNLLFYIANSNTVKVTGGGAAYGVYAPRAPVTISGGADIWGSVVGQTITSTGGAKVHYDRDLGTVGTRTASVATWQRF